MFSPDATAAVLRLRIEYLGVCFIPTLFYHGAVKLAGAARRTELLICYSLSAVFTILISLLRHPAFLPDAAPIAYLPYWGKAGSLYFLFVGFFSLLVVRGHLLLWSRSQKETDGLKRKQLRYFFFSSAIAYLAAVPEFSLKFGFRIPYLQPFGLYAVPLYMALVTYIIIQFKLFEIEVVIRKSLVYSVLVTALTVGYFGLVYGIEQLFQTTLGYTSPWVSLSAFALMALAFQPLKIAIQRAVDWLVFRVPQEHLMRRMERLEEQALQAEKFKAVSTLAAGMSHEIKNPLTALKTFTDFIPEKHRDPDFARKLHETFRQETDRIQNIVQDVLDFAKPRPAELRALDLSPLLTSTIDLLSADLLKHRIKWSIHCGHNGAKIQADPGQLRQVLINLIQNAADAMPKGGMLTLATQANNGHLELAVSDTGCGIPAELLPKIFDPFVSGKPRGNGLGLAMVYSIVQAHGGTIRAASRPGRGTTFTVILPL